MTDMIHFPATSLPQLYSYKFMFTTFLLPLSLFSTFSRGIMMEAEFILLQQ